MHKKFIKNRCQFALLNQMVKLLDQFTSLVYPLGGEFRPNVLLLQLFNQCPNLNPRSRATWTWLGFLSKLQYSQ